MYKVNVKTHKDVPVLLWGAVIALFISTVFFAVLAVRNAIPPVCELETDYLGRTVCALRLNDNGDLDG